MNLYSVDLLVPNILMQFWWAFVEKNVTIVMSFDIFVVDCGNFFSGFSDAVASFN